MDWLTLLQAAPSVIRLLNELNGPEPPRPLDLIQHDGFKAAANIWRPGTGDLVDRVVTSGREAYQEWRHGQGGHIVEGEYREVREPWAPFVSWLLRQKWGAWCILGRKGSGKTTLAMRLAEVWQERTRYRVELANVYGDDAAYLPGAKTISMDVLAARLVRLQKYLNAGIDDGEGDVLDEIAAIAKDAWGEEDDAGDDEGPVSIESMKRRIILIDESSLVVGNHGADAGRAIIRRLMAQIRHLDSHIIFIGQLAKMLPSDTFTAEATFVKQPYGDEPDLDRQEPVIRRLWAEVIDHFEGLKESPWRYDYPDLRSWAYVHCPSMTGTQGSYRGLVPFNPPTAMQREIEGEY